MKLTVTERLVLLGALPATGNWAAIRTMRTMRELLDLSDEEREIIELTVDPQGQTLRWNAQKADGIGAKEVPLSGPAVAQVVKVLKELDKKEALTPQHASLCEKFLEQPAVN